MVLADGSTPSWAVVQNYGSPRGPLALAREDGSFTIEGGLVASALTVHLDDKTVEVPTHAYPGSFPFTFVVGADEEADARVVQCRLRGRDVEKGEAAAIVACANFAQGLFSAWDHPTLNRLGFMSGFLDALGGKSDFALTLEAFHRQICLHLPLLGGRPIDIRAVQGAIG